VEPGGGSGGERTATGLSCTSCGTELPPDSRFCNKCGTPITPIASSAEYKQVTVLFADVVHSMDIAAAVGVERLREIMADLADRCAAVVQRYGGTVDKFTGDGIMAVFGAPMALEDHAVRACLAGLAIQDEAKQLAIDVRDRDGVELSLRVGLNSGQVIAGEIGSGPFGYTTIGEQVGMAQRMESASPPGEVMLSATTTRLVEGAAALGERELVPIKGADEPAAAYRLMGMRQDRTVRHAESSLVGRRWEMSAVEGLLDRAIDGRGAVVGLVGPAGIGKSRLAREVAAMAGHRGVEVFRAYCESHTNQVPFHVVTKLLRAASRIEGRDPRAARALIEAEAFSDAEPDDVALFEDLLGIRDPDAELPRIDPDARRRRLTALVNSATLANQAPAVYVIEDAHWIDESSESLLADFLTVVPQTRLLTLITYRPEYRGALAQVPGAQSIALSPLSNRDTAALVSELLGPDPSIHELSQTIAERAAGTPYFAEEIVRELAERGVLRGHRGAYVSMTEATEVNVPDTLQATIAARIDRLDPKAKRTLSAAAVVGSRFGWELLTRLRVEPEVTDLLGAQLIDQVKFTPQPEYVFHHPLIRAVAYEAQLKSDRADLHRRVAAAIEQDSARSQDENASLIAEHLEAAGDLHAAFDWHMRAGGWSNNRDAAAARVSWERARQAADRLPEDDPSRTAMCIASRTTLCATAWRVPTDDLGPLFDELRELCTVADDKTSLAMAMMGPMSAHAQRGEVRESQRFASELMALLDSIGDPALTAQAAFGAIGIKSQAGDVSEVLRWAEATIEWADGDPTKGNLIVGSPLAMALALRGLARSWLGSPGWREDLDDAVAFAEQSADPLTLALTISWKYGFGIWDRVLRPDDAAIRTTERALQTAEASGDDYAVVMVRFILASVLLLRGTPGDRHRGLEMMVHVRDTCVQQRFLLAELPVMDVYLGQERARSGDRDGAISVIRKSLDDMITRRQLSYCIPATGVLVETLLERGTDGDVNEAQNAVARLASASANKDLVISEIWSLRLHALLTKARGDESAYREFRDRYRAMATSLGFEGHMAWAEAMP
jgi:adenylate cyclase